MVKKQIVLRNIQPPAASATTVVDLPLGYRYHSILIQHGYAGGTNTVAAAMSNLSQIRLVANGGQVIRRVSGTEMRDLNLLNGTQYDAQGVPNTSPGVGITMHFAEPWRSSAADRDALALATTWKGGALSGLQLQIDLGAATTPTINCYAIVDNFVPELQPAMVKWIRQDITASGTSMDAKLDPLGFLQALHLYPHDGGTPAKASKVTLRQGEDILSELTSSASFALLSALGLFPTATGRSSNITDVVFDNDDLLRSSVPLAGGPTPTLTIEHSAAASGTIRAVIERLERI